MKNLFKISIDPNRIYGLDILRAFAILTVVIHHGRYILPHQLRPFNYLFEFDGVTVFFVLSGFLIGGILIKNFEKKEVSFPTLKEFWIRRWLRTLPNYFLILTTLFAIEFAFNASFQSSIAAPYFIFCQNLFQPHPENFFPEAWSLSVEEWFYLSVPFAVFLMITLLKIPVKRAIEIICVVVLAGSIAIRYQRYLTIHPSDISNYELLLRKQVVTRLDSLIVGVFGAYLNFYKNNFWLKHKNFSFTIGILLLIVSRFLFTPKFYISWLYVCVFSFLLISIGTLLVIPFISQLKKGSGRVYRILTVISLISYSMYLVNLTLINKWILSSFIKEEFFNPYSYRIIYYFSFWTVTIGLSILLYKFIEKPFMDLRNKSKTKETDALLTH